MLGFRKENTLTHVYDALSRRQRNATVAVLNEFPSEEWTPRIDRFLAREMLLNAERKDDAVGAFARFAVMEGTRAPVK